MKQCCLVWLLGLSVIGNVFSQNPGRNESLIVVNALFSNLVDTVEIYVDDQKNSDIKHNSPVNVIVPNGDHTITFVALNGHLLNAVASKKDFPIKLNSERAVIELRVNNFRVININLKSQTKLDNNVSSSTASNSNAIEDAINRITDAFRKQLPGNSIIAVLSISSSDQDIVAFTIEELEYQLVNTNQFKIVDRKTLDSVRNEQNFQMSGEVSDDSAVSIGNMLGANIVITGNITGAGSTRRITIKAVDVKTSQILASSRESF